jgi:nucleoside-diphosphate-sugar epimerase
VHLKYPAIASLCGVEVAVTGAGGFLGGAVLKELQRVGAKIRAVLGPPGLGDRVPQGVASISEMDICDLHNLESIFAGATVVIHLAGLASVADSFENATEHIRVHTLGTACVLQACRTAQVSKVVYISSAEVYGQPRSNPVAEDHPLEARSPYAAAKIGAEKLIESYVAAFSQRAVVLRPFSIYGPGVSVQSLVGRILRMAQSGEAVVLQDLKPVRDYIFVDDVARAVCRACLLDLAGFQVFNIGTMQGLSVAEIAERFVQVMGEAIPVLEQRNGKRPGRSEIYRLVADNRRGQAILGWEPRTSLEEGLRLTAAGLP